MRGGGLAVEAGAPYLCVLIFVSGCFSLVG